MKYIFASERTFEPWDWRNPNTQGIGGSETSHIEMARRLAARGHEVKSYAPVDFDGVQENEGVLWRKIEDCDYSEDCDVWVIYRAPNLLDHLKDGAISWLICQDVDYKHKERGLNNARLDKLTRLVALCGEQARHLRDNSPGQFIKKVCQSSNGIKAELIEEIERENLPRNPKRLMYASSPDRGMEFLLDIFPRAKEIVPDLELHLYYGFDNIEKIIARPGYEKSWIARNAERLKAFTDQEGVINHGRTAQPELIRQWFQSGIWCHPSNFTETSCITCMDAQACGAIPITNPVWAVKENVRHGVFIEGDVRSDLIRSRYVLELVRMALDDTRQAFIRREMMGWARHAFTWENFVTQWENWAEVDVERKQAPVRELEGVA
jgi:glycosyltransferase involved in cell wall biosynthesis